MIDFGQHFSLVGNAALDLLGRPTGRPVSVLLPAVQSVRSDVDEILDQIQCSEVEVHVIDPSDRYSAFQASVLALACCGTVNVELALSGTPQVALWRSSWLTHLLIRGILRPSVPYATLPNILAHHLRHGTLASLTDKDAPIEECLFERCAAEPVANAAIHLLENRSAAAAQVAALANLMEWLTAREADGSPAVPSKLAAKALLRRVSLRFCATAVLR